MAVWVSFWCSSRLTRKNARLEPVHAALVHTQRGKSSFVIYQTVVFSFFNRKSCFSEEGEKLLCNLSTGGTVAFSKRYQDFWKRGKSCFVIYRTVICCFFLEKSTFSEEGENLFCNLSKVDIFVFFLL